MLVKCSLHFRNNSVNINQRLDLQRVAFTGAGSGLSSSTGQYLLTLIFSMRGEPACTCTRDFLLIASVHR